MVWSMISFISGLVFGTAGQVASFVLVDNNDWEDCWPIRLTIHIGFFICALALSLLPAVIHYQIG